jgi:ABC-type branched-subunit amino acid transport system ATPase component
MNTLLRLTNISKSFAGVRALKGVSFGLQAGEVHALVGENGAGKSTLIKIITGAHQPDDGTIEVNGQLITENSPLLSRSRGIAVIYQRPALLPDLTVSENIALSLEPRGALRRIRWAPRKQRARELLARVGASIDPDALVQSLSMPEQQLVEIARALGADAKILILDEPTSVLTPVEADEVLGLGSVRDTVEVSKKEPIDLDLVTHDAKKFFGLMLKTNGYVMEQLHSRLVVRTTPEHEELKAPANGCLTKHHAHHYLGFAATQYSLFQKEDPPRVKPLLYVFRVLLTGIHLMRTGEIEANLVWLNETAKLSYIPELIARKTGGPEKGTLEKGDLDFYGREYERLRAELEQASSESRLPEAASATAALNDLLVRLRLK